MFFFDRLGQEKPDITAAEDQQLPGFAFLMAEGGHGAGHLFGIDDEINLVAGDHMVVGCRHHGLGIPHQADDDDIEIGEKLRQLPERCIDQRAGLFAAHPDQLHLVVDQRDHFECARHLKAARYGAGDLYFQ